MNSDSSIAPSSTAFEVKTQENPILATNPQKIISGSSLFWTEIKVRFVIFKILAKHFKNPLHLLKTAKALDKTRRSFLGESRIKKLASVGGKHYWDLFLPSFESPAFSPYLEAEINRITPISTNSNRLVNVLMSITKKCPLQCAHCYEWDALNGKERIGVNELDIMVQKINAAGIANLQLTGGEPLMKPEKIIQVLKSIRKETDVWVLSSGFRLTDSLAAEFKANNLTGIFISLDHYLAEKHNQFRGFADAFYWAQTAVENAKRHNLVVALSVCVTRDLATLSFLEQYLKLAKSWGVAFVQFLEPKAVGHFGGQDVLLKKEHTQILEKVFWDYNFSGAYPDFPIITYHGYYQRRTGCFASGNRTVYIDTDGDLHACPFCQTKMGSAVYDDWHESLDRLQSKGCHSFKSAKL